MSLLSEVLEKAVKVACLTAGSVVRAAGILVGKAEQLSLKEISCRLDGALRALGGEPAIEEMKAVLRDADCLYDDEKIWRKLGAATVPPIPDGVIQEAYKKGGRVVLQCSSISAKADALLQDGHKVHFLGCANRSDYTESVSNPKWIVVPSHIDPSTLRQMKSQVITSDSPAPTPENWFSAIAYARLSGGRQPKGCEGLHAFTTETGTVVGSHVGGISVHRDGDYDHYGYPGIGAARFGPPRN
jgi:hypothetical protein